MIPSRRLDGSIIEEEMPRPIRDVVGRNKSFRAGREGGQRRGEGGMWVRRKWRVVKDWMTWHRNDAKMDYEDKLHK